MSVVLKDGKPGVFTVFGRSGCVWCSHAIDLLDFYGRTYEYRNTYIPEHREFLVSNGFTTVPQIWHGTDYIGGYQELGAYLRK